jgi:hypothetical protein
MSMIDCPSARIFLARAVIARVADGVSEATLFEKRTMTPESGN